MLKGERFMEQENGHKKGRKIILIVFLILSMILIMTYCAYGYYKNKVLGEILKKELLSNVIQNDSGFFLENEVYDTITQKMQKEAFEMVSKVRFSTTMEENMLAELDLSKFELISHFAKNDVSQKTSSQLETKYAGNDLLTFFFITTPNQIAIKSDEIVNQYVGISKVNFQNIVNEIYQTQVDISDGQKMKHFICDREWIRFSDLLNGQPFQKYVHLVEQEIVPENISKKENVVIIQNDEQIATTEYTVSLDQNQVKHLLEGISQTVETDEETISKFVVSNVYSAETDGILEYTDNDNTVEISGEENNFNTSLEIWGQNTANEVQTINTIPSNSVSEENNVTNEIQNQTIFEPIHTNTIEENTSTSEEMPSEEVVQPIIEEQPMPETTNQETETQPNSPPVLEEDNFRTQGFIEVNENTEYASEEDTFVIGDNYEETLKNIANWIEKIDWSSYLLTGAKANCKQEELIEQIQSILAKRIKQNHSLIIKVYVSDAKTLKITFEVPETLEKFDIEILSKGENEKYLKLTSLMGKEEEASGTIYNLYRKKADALDTVQINIQQISKSKISQKLIVRLQTKGTLNTKQYDTDIQVMYSNVKGEFKVELANTLKFDVTPEIEDLNEQNCLFLDTLPKEELLLTSEAIKQKIREVLREKNRNLNIIDVNNSNLVVQPTQPDVPNEQNVDQQKQVKQDLIKTIADKMRDYQNEGKQLKLEDLEGLTIPGYDVQISISANLALITVNGYQFKLDSEFNLSD